MVRISCRAAKRLLFAPDHIRLDRSAPCRRRNFGEKPRCYRRLFTSLTPLILYFACPVTLATVPPANDSCVQAIPVTDGVTVQSNLKATTDGTASCGFLGEDGAADVWFVYTAPITGVVAIDTCATSPTTPPFDSVLSVFDSCGGSELACNDDFFDVCTQLTSYVEFLIVQGEDYWIRVAEYRGWMGSFVLTIASVPGTGCSDGLCALSENNVNCPDDCTSLLEFADFQVCFSGAQPAASPQCDAFDADDGGEIDLADFHVLFTDNFVGP